MDQLSAYLSRPEFGDRVKKVQFMQVCTPTLELAARMASARGVELCVSRCGVVALRERCSVRW